MFAVVGATGKTGSSVVSTLQAAGKSVRALVRLPRQVEALQAAGVQAAIADIRDVVSLQRAFDGCEAAYLMNPHDYHSADMFESARIVHDSLLRAANAVGLPRIVALSSIGAQHPRGTGNILTTHDFEGQLQNFHGRATVLRAANFMENWASSIPGALKSGVLPSMFRPVELAIPMIAAKDVGTAAAHLLMSGSTELLYSLESRDPVSPNETAEVLSRLTHKPVLPIAVDEAEFINVFLKRGLSLKVAEAFSEMFMGFNSGLIRFEGIEKKLYGHTTLEESIGALIASSAGGIR